MTSEEIKIVVKEAVKEAHDELYIDPKQHYEDHGFVASVRGGIRTVRRGSLWALGATIFGFIIWIFQSIFNITPPTAP